MFSKELFFKACITCTLLIVSSCSTTPDKFAYVNTPDRIPATEPVTCNELAQSIFLKDNYQTDLVATLANKKLLSFSDKFITIEHPNLDWINSARASLNKSIKNWNSNKYPAFYIFSDEDVVSVAKRYFKVTTDKVPADSIPEEDAIKDYELVQSWIKSYENYQTEVEQLLEEKISLQYNLSLLKKLKLKDDEKRDIKITIKRAGQFVDEVVTLRKSDKDLEYQIAKIKSELKDFDGSLINNGKIKDRIIRQAALKDMLTIVQREFEYSLKNSPAVTDDMGLELERLEALIKKPELQPTTYGVYRISNQVFIRELVALSKLDLVYKNFVQTPVLKFREVVNAFIQNRPLKNATNQEKVGIFKRIYAKISSITLKQASIGTGITVTAGIGFERYFSLASSQVEVLDHDSHANQIEQTEEEARKANEDHTKVVEVKINELIGR